MNIKYKFEPHLFELPIESKREIECKVWEAAQPSPSVVVIEYDLGKDLEDKELQSLAEHIVSKYNMSVVAVEYIETKVKYSPHLLGKLESYLPNHLRKCSKYLSDRHQKLIEQGAFQDVINDLQYNPYIRIPINKETIISLYGDEESYTDFGVAASLDIIYSIEQLKQIYSSWKWNDCIGVGIGYGAYILQLAERFDPNIFSLLIGKNSLIKPIASDIFVNRTELENGNLEFVYHKNIGKFPLYLNEVQGWTTLKSHPHFFEQRHYDIRNLENEQLLQRGNKQTPLIFIEEINSKGLKQKINFVENLIRYDYSIELFIADEDEVDNQAVIKENGIIKIKLEGIFDHYLDKGYTRNLSDSKENDITILPVNNGVYVLNNISSLPKLLFIQANPHLEEKDEMEYLKQYFNEDIKKFKSESLVELLNFIKYPLLHQDENYIKMLE